MNLTNKIIYKRNWDHVNKSTSKSLKAKATSNYKIDLLEDLILIVLISLLIIYGATI